MGRSRLRYGWAAMTAGSVATFLLSAVVGAVKIVVSIRDGDVFGLVGALVGGAAALLFWWWIGMGSWQRAVDPVRAREPGEQPYAAPEVGPWGWVGRILIGLMVVGFGAVLILGNLSDRRARERAERVRDRAVSIARLRHVTVEQVRTARARGLVSFAETRRPLPLDELLPVAGARVLDARAGSNSAVVLVRPDGGPPCVELTIYERGGGPSAEIVGRCRLG